MDYDKQNHTRNGHVDINHLGVNMPNYSGAASGAISGATTGLGIGGPIGGAVGGLVGGISGLFGKKKKKKKVSSFDKRQQQLNEEQYQSLRGEGPLADLYNYDPEMANQVFDKTVANPAYRKYKEDLAPAITGNFRKNGLENSSYVSESLGKTARDIQEGLDAQRSQYLYGEQNNARNAKRNAVENLQNRSTFAYDKNNEGGFDIDQILKSVPAETIDQLRQFFKGGK